MTGEEESFISRSSGFFSKALCDVWRVWLALAVVTTLPYAVAALRTPEGHAFTGVLTAYDDTFTYFAWMRQAADGHVLTCDLFTSEAQSCNFFLPLWSVLGLIARVTHLSLPVTFHIARLLAGLLLLVVARSITLSVMKSRTRVRYTLWLYAMSCGLGWLVYVCKSGSDLLKAASGSVDLNMPEAIAFRAVFAQVHFAVGVAILCGAIKLVFKALAEKRTNRAMIAGFLVSLLAVVHPYMIVLVGAVVGVILVTWPWLIDARNASRADYSQAARVSAAFFFATIPGAAYLVYINRSSLIAREWLRVTDTLSPPPWEYALGFGVVAALAVIGFRLMWRSRAPFARMLIVWAVVQAALLYAPVSFQRRLVEGLQLPVCIAASVALFWIAGEIFKRRHVALHRRLFLGGIILFASITNVGFVAGQVIAPGSGSVPTDPRRYVPVDLISTFKWLRTNAESDAILFSSYMTGNLAPSMTGLRVYLGHYGQTLRSSEKGEEVAEFYRGSLSDDAARKFFAERRVSYVIYGPLERTITDSFSPPACLELVRRFGEVQLFRVSLED